MASSKRRSASGAPSSPCFGALVRSVSGDSTRPIAISSTAAQSYAGGVIERPDVVDEELEAWEPEALGSGFAIEDALVRDAEWSEVRAAGGVIKRSRLEGVKFSGARMRSLRLVDCIVRRL